MYPQSEEIFQYLMVLGQVELFGFQDRRIATNEVPWQIGFGWFWLAAIY
jgi:hypothetical protein